MLTTQQLHEIEQLQKEVELYDDLELKLNWEMLRNRDSTQLDHLYYENDKLIAFIGLYSFGSTVEVTGMVKPDERRKGHFSKLFDQAMAAVRQNGFNKILLNAPASSAAAKEFLRNIGAVYSFTEHQMEWKPQPLEDVSGFQLRTATNEDLEVRIRLDVEAFGYSKEDARAMETRLDGDEDTEMLMIDADGETVGKIRVARKSNEAWIYGFSILPEHQGKGIGRKVLRRTVKHQHDLGYSVHLDVETKNAQALGLYESVGFEVMHAQDYYLYSNK
ncbi:GNAT family N-acetyltransferase [Planococcus halotolerans]|uniref:GNAT family N-acetyltransferase n=1 Tax=Planococcus halotolerans TaxID=2233542 RepID=A0A365KYC6_9BACL|nr:GNAT family N-acetyltransferase [Planococcus halotolerans]QHJ72195.1 GNAT family N-acetyltransferase [Planococcus halotolerans]RAZ77787.1 GNAT family N-acetyltransferase [Planococcus halotolerans]